MADVAASKEGVILGEFQGRGGPCGGASSNLYDWETNGLRAGQTSKHEEVLLELGWMYSKEHGGLFMFRSSVSQIIIRFCRRSSPLSAKKSSTDF